MKNRGCVFEVCTSVPSCAIMVFLLHMMSWCMIGSEVVKMVMEVKVVVLIMEVIMDEKVEQESVEEMNLEE